ncbi:GTPase [Streptomyces sp. NPDC006172]|uniref:GTPase n=1 Tax=Streptomyces sp. NPDC006172 TaxID=3154470 RepID=UPI0033CF206A
MTAVTDQDHTGNADHDPAGSGEGAPGGEAGTNGAPAQAAARGGQADAAEETALDDGDGGEGTADAERPSGAAEDASPPADDPSPARKGREHTRGRMSVGWARWREGDRAARKGASDRKPRTSAGDHPERTPGTDRQEERAARVRGDDGSVHAHGDDGHAARAREGEGNVRVRDENGGAHVRKVEGGVHARGGASSSRGRSDERHARGRQGGGRAPATGQATAGDASTPQDGGEFWDDGLIARRVNEATAAEQNAAAAAAATGITTAGTTGIGQARPGGGPQAVPPLAYDVHLRSRLDALSELVGLSRARLDSKTLAEAGRVLDEAAARRKLSGQHTVVAIAGATGSGKSQLFNTLAGVTISETGVRRPTTAAPIACSWSDGAASLIDRLGIPGRLRRRPVQSADAEAQLQGLVLIDLPDHDSAAVQHREQVDRILALVDAVIWVVDPEKYADAVLHERYLRPMAGHAEVMFIVLNQIDRLPGEAAEMVLDDLRRLLDEDGVALGEYGEPGATVLALSGLTGDGVGELRELLGQFVTERGAAARRISADVDAAAGELRPVYVTGRSTGLSEEARDEFAARLADAVGAVAAGEAAERAWLRNANRACGTPWLRLWRWYQDRCDPPTGRMPFRAQADEEATARQRVEQAVRTVSERASAGLPAPWAQAVREAAVRGAQGLPEALDELAAQAGLPPGRPPRPGWWPAAVMAQASMTILQVIGGLWLFGQIVGVMSPNLGVPVLLMVAGIIGGPLVEWGCRMAARGPARRYGQDAERRLREAAASCGRARVLDSLAAELLRYREVREQYGRVTGVTGVTGMTAVAGVAELTAGAG